MNDPPCKSSPSEPGLLRALGPWMAMAMIVGNIVGSGIFYKPGNIAAECNSFPLILGIWVLGGFLCLLGALCFAEMAAMLPQAGGTYVYLREAYGSLVSFLYGWTRMLFSRPGSLAALSIVFVGSLGQFLQWQFSTLEKVMGALALLVGLAWVNTLGVIWGGRIQLLITIGKVAFLVLISILPFVLHLFTGSTIQWHHYTSTLSGGSLSLSTQMAVVLLSVMWAYNGWKAITPLAEEIQQPQRTIPFAVFRGVALVILLYALANIAYHGALSMSEMAQAGDHAAEVMLRKVLGPAGQSTVSLIILWSTFGTINILLLQTSRISYAMARDGLLMKSAAKVHPRYHAPNVSILLTAALAGSLILLAAMAKYMARDVPLESLGNGIAQRALASLRDDSIFKLLTTLVVASGILFNVLSVLAVIVLRIRHPEWERPYRTWGYPVVPLLFVGIYLWFLVESFRGRPLEAITGMALILLGIPVYLLLRAKQRKQKGA